MTPNTDVDDKSSIHEAYIINAIFFALCPSSSAQRKTRPLKTRAQVTAKSARGGTAGAMGGADDDDGGA
jgi:hypothetical protein